MSKIQIESKSQLMIEQLKIQFRWISVCQRYKLKANHNMIWLRLFLMRVNISMSKIQIESKSQLLLREAFNSNRWISVCQRYKLKANHNPEYLGALSLEGEYQYVKDTNWKQITTNYTMAKITVSVNISMSKIQIESKSQH